MNKTVLLIRHCHATGGELEAPLTEEGHAQAQVLASWLSQFPVDRIIVSDYLRARQTIEPFAKLTGKQIDVDSRLGERVFSATPLPDWHELLIRSYDDLDLRYEGGETSREAMERGVAALKDIVAHGASVTVAVSHGNLTTLLLKSIDDKYGYEDWLLMTKPDVYRLTFTQEGATVERLQIEGLTPAGC